MAVRTLLGHALTSLVTTLTVSLPLKSGGVGQLSVDGALDGLILVFVLAEDFLF